MLGNDCGMSQLMAATDSDSDDMLKVNPTGRLDGEDPFSLCRHPYGPPSAQRQSGNKGDSGVVVM